MSSIFSKQNRFAVDISENGRKEKKFYSVLSLVLLIVGSVVFWEQIYELSHMIGAIVSGSCDVAMLELKRMFPIHMIGIILIYMAMNVVAAFRAYDEQHRIKIWRVSGNITIALSLIVIIYVGCGILTGEYGEIIEGYPTLLFPLDMLLAGAGLAVYGGLSMIYSVRLRRKHTSLPFRTELTKSGARRSAIKPWYVLNYMIALCGFSASIKGIYVLDFRHGYLFFNITFWLMYFLSFAMYVVYRFIYLDLREELKGKAELSIGFFFLIVNVIVLILYIISVNIYNEAPNQNAYGLLPIDFTSGFNAFLLIYGCNNIITPLVVIINGFIYRSKHKKV